MPRQGCDDEAWMEMALEIARSAQGWGDVPIGCVVVKEGQLVAAAGNEREQTSDATAHAELIAIRRACKRLGTWRLSGCSLYVTLEPCFMCAGAIVNSRLDRVIFGATDPKAGAVVSLAEVLTDSRLNHRCQQTGGVRAHDCGLLLREFFKRRRGHP